MNLITPAIEENNSLRAVGYDVIPSTVGEALKASSKESFVRSPGPSLHRFLELQMTKGYDVQYMRTPQGFMGPSIEFNPDEEVTGKHLTSEEWGQSEHYRPGLSFPKGITEEAARLIAKRKDEERTRQDVINRAPKSLPVSAAILTTDLLTGVLDPLNVAAAFVPVVREARAALWMQRLGKVGGRLAVGAVEGVAGAAMVEPIVLGAAKAEQSDYDMTDSLINVGFGTVFGGGLHVGVGAIGDKLAKIRIHAREAALKTAVGQVADGRAVNVEPLIKNNSARIEPKTEIEAWENEFRQVSKRVAEIDQEPGAKLSPEEIADNQRFSDLLEEGRGLSMQDDIFSLGRDADQLRNQPEPLYTDRGASIEADKFIRDIPENPEAERINNEITNLSQELDHMFKNNQVDPLRVEELNLELKSLDTAADTYSKAVDAAVNCLVRVM